MVEKAHAGTLWPSLADPLRGFGARLAEWVAPASEAKAGKDSYSITVELPGVAESDVTLSVEGGVVTLRGEKRSEREEKGDTWFFSERQYGAFTRSFRLPPDADEERIAADMKDGVLTVTVPKKPPEPGASRAVRINAG